MPPKKTPVKDDSLEGILGRHGPDSEIFYRAIERYIYFIAHRHMVPAFKQVHIQDVVTDCYAAVIRVLRAQPYDPKRGYLKTYIYTIVRNEISTQNKKLIKDSVVNFVETYDGLEPLTDPKPVHDATEGLLMKVWRTGLGAYHSELVPMIQMLAEGRVSVVGNSVNPRVREALRVYMWDRYMEAEGFVCP